MLLAAALSTHEASAQVTAQEAESLPLPELSRKVLGETGSLMLDVDRPRFKGSLDSVRFYGHAVVTGTQFGMCGADWVTVNFEDNRVESVSAQRRFGIEGQIYREPGAWTYDESGAICGAVKATRTYFPAPDAQAALEIALYVDAIKGRGPFAKQTFTFHCEGICDQRRAVLNALKLREIDQARKIDCDATSPKLPSCFELVIGESEVGPYPKTFRVYGSNYMNKIVISSVKVHVGSTLD